jgi:hypothetical protein
VQLHNFWPRHLMEVMISLTSRPLYRRYPSNRRLGWPQIRSGRQGKEKILAAIGTRTPDSPVKPVASRYTDYSMKEMFLDERLSSLHTATNCNYSVFLAGRQTPLRDQRGPQNT